MALTYICVRLTDGTARIYFALLLISPGTSNLIVEDHSSTVT